LISKMMPTLRGTFSVKKYSTRCSILSSHTWKSCCLRPVMYLFAESVTAACTNTRSMSTRNAGEVRVWPESESEPEPFLVPCAKVSIAHSSPSEPAILIQVIKPLLSCKQVGLKRHGRHRTESFRLAGV